MHDPRDPCRQLGCRIAGATHGSGGVNRDSAASSDGALITRSNRRLRLTSNSPVHTQLAEGTSVRERTGANIRRGVCAEQDDDGDQPGRDGCGTREVRVGGSTWVRLVIPALGRIQ